MTDSRSRSTSGSISSLHPISRVSLGVLSALIVMCSSPLISVAQFPGGGARTFLTTDTAVCDPDLGTVEVDVDAFGALGSALSSTNRHYNPFDDIPDQGYVSTIFEWKTFFCKETPSGTASGTWLNDRAVTANPTVSITNGEVQSEFIPSGGSRQYALLARLYDTQVLLYAHE